MHASFTFQTTIKQLTGTYSKPTYLWQPRLSTTRGTAVKILQKRWASGASPQTPLGELTAGGEGASRSLPKNQSTPRLRPQLRAGGP